jgi:UDP-N-acetylglucosamine:LPS N-acetylglucosamine transferase
MRQSEMTEESLAAALQACLDHPQSLPTMAVAASAAATPDAAQRVSDYCEELMHVQ